MRAVVIGAGLGGLECAQLLAKKGFEVLVLEQQSQPGGSMQCFRRHGIPFDTGFHCVGGLDPGERLWQLFESLDLNRLPWRAMDRDGFDHVMTDGRAFLIPVGHEAFAERLKGYFPKQQQQIDHYVELLKLVGDHIGGNDGTREKMLALPAYESLCKMFTDPTLIQVVSGASMKMDLDPERLPLYSFLQINDSYLRGAYRLEGGGECLVRKLQEDIESMGSQIVTSAHVDKIAVANGRVTGVEASLSDGTRLHVDRPAWVISDINPLATFDMIEGAALRPVYRRRIASMPNSRGIFTANLVMKDDTLPYQNHNLFIHKEGDLWHRKAQEVQDVMIHYAVTHEGEPTRIDLMSPMDWSVVEPYADKDYHADEGYQELKQRWLDEMIDLASTQLPSLRENIAYSYTSTPLTYRRYNGVAQGAAFGIERDWHKGGMDVISPRTPISNLLLTGQNLMLHGILGVTMTAMDTISHIVGPFKP